LKIPNWEEAMLDLPRRRNRRKTRFWRYPIEEISWKWIIMKELELDAKRIVKNHFFFHLVKKKIFLFFVCLWSWNWIFVIRKEGFVFVWDDDWDIGWCDWVICEWWILRIYVCMKCYNIVMSGRGRFSGLIMIMNGNFIEMNCVGTRKEFLWILFNIRL
jgi:hypothetical protein